jgi:excisionase family DNA binding protein
MKTNSEMFTTAEVAKLLHLHPNTVRSWANKRLLRAYRLGSRRDRRFKQEDLDRFIEHNNHKS